METAVSLYQLSTTLITVYGYWKVANVSYTNYSRAKTLFDITVGVFDKVHNLITKLGPDSEHLANLPLDQIEDIKNELEKHKNLPRIYYSKKPFKTHWEIVHKDEIKSEMDTETTPTTSYFLPNLVSFYSWEDEKGNTISEL